MRINWQVTCRDSMQVVVSQAYSHSTCANIAIYKNVQIFYRVVIYLAQWSSEPVYSLAFFTFWKDTNSKIFIKKNKNFRELH